MKEIGPIVGTDCEITMKEIGPIAGIDCENTMTKINLAEGTDHQSITKIIMKGSIIVTHCKFRYFRRIGNIG